MQSLIFLRYEVYSACYIFQRLKARQYCEREQRMKLQSTMHLRFYANI